MPCIYDRASVLMILQKWEMVPQLLNRIKLLKIMALKGENLIKPHQGKDILKIDGGWKRDSLLFNDVDFFGSTTNNGVALQS